MRYIYTVCVCCTSKGMSPTFSQLSIYHPIWADSMRMRGWGWEMREGGSGFGIDISTQIARDVTCSVQRVEQSGIFLPSHSYN